MLHIQLRLFQRISRAYCLSVAQRSIPLSSIHFQFMAAAAEAARLHRSSQFIENHVPDTSFINHAKHGNVTLIFDAVHVTRITHSHFEVAGLVSTVQLRYQRQRRRRIVDFNNFSTYRSQLDKNQCPSGIDVMELNVRLKRVQYESLIDCQEQ